MADGPRSTVVGPEGPLDAALVIVGRDPGWQEVAQGRPFVGEAGKVLDAALQGAGLDRAACLITNVVGVRPARDDWTSHSEAEIVDGFDRLHTLLRRGDRHMVCALGAQAFYTCATGRPAPQGERGVTAALAAEFGGSITELRGYVWPGPYGPVLATVHPAFVLRTWLPWRACLEWDLQKAARMLAGRGRSPRFSHYARTHEEARVIGASLVGQPTLAVDSEEPPVACVAFAADAARGVSFVVERDADIIAELLASPARKLFQNAQYDLTRFARQGWTVNGPVEDIMLKWHSIEPLIAGKSESAAKASQKSLRFLASVFTDEPFWKDYEFHSDEDKWRLCATDARVTFEINDALNALAAQRDGEAVVHGLTHAA